MNDATATAGADRRELVLHCSIAAALLVGLALVFLAAPASRDGAGVLPAAPRVHAPAGPVLDDPVAGDFSRFALNALLVPLLDDDEPPRWTDVPMRWACGPATHVEVNGKALVPGATIPANAFTVSWNLDSCTQLEAFELSGVVELLVFHEDTGLSAVVNAVRATVSSASGTHRPSVAFAASMALVAAADRPPHVLTGVETTHYPTGRSIAAAGSKGVATARSVELNGTTTPGRNTAASNNALKFVGGAVSNAALSAAIVGVLLSTLRRAGPRAIGLAAAIPINSVPALFWLSLEHGTAYAASAVPGALWGTGLTVLLGATFARLASTLHPAAAALLAWIGVGALAMTTSTLPSVPIAAAAMTLCAILVGRAALAPLPACDSPRRAGADAGCLLSMAAAGAMTLLVSELSRHCGPQLCGLVAAIPVVCMCALTVGYRRGGAPLMLRILHGYLDGMAAKAAFLGALGCAWAVGAGASGWLIGLACAAFTLLTQHRLGEQTRHREAHPQATVRAEQRHRVMRPCRTSPSQSAMAFLQRNPTHRACSSPPIGG